MTASASYPPAGAPPAPPVVQGSKRSATWTGFLMIIGAIVGAVGTFLPYEKLADSEGGTFKITGLGSVSTTGGVPKNLFEVGTPGAVALAVGVVLLVLGLLVVLRQGRLWVSIVGLVVGLIGTALALVAFSTPGKDATDRGNELNLDLTGTVEIGAILAAAGLGVATVAALLALIIRRRQV